MSVIVTVSAVAEMQTLLIFAETSNLVVLELLTVVEVDTSLES